jgi:two-component system, response regulator
VSTAEILLIEDNPDDAELTIYALRTSGIANNISHIADGRLALERLLDDTLQVPMLVLLDLKLPGLDGLEIQR